MTCQHDDYELTAEDLFVEEPYNTYPAATWFVPVWSMSSKVDRLPFWETRS